MEHTISAAQFFAVQFLIRVTMTIALDPSAIAGENPLNTLLSYGLAMVLGAGLAVPVWLLHRQPGMAFGEQARKALGPLGRVVGLFYILYFVAANALSLGAFLELLEKRLHPEFPLVLILAAVVAVAAYGAWRGLETIARAGACLCVLVLAGTALLFGTAAGRFQWETFNRWGTPRRCGTRRCSSPARPFSQRWPCCCPTSGAGGAWDSPCGPWEQQFSWPP